MGKAILVVDDAPVMRQMIKFALRAVGCPIDEASSGSEAMEKIKSGLDPALIITDLNMPRMDGIELTRAVRALPCHKHTPILLLTAESIENRKTEIKNAGATGWIMKPFTPEHLLKIINTFGL